MADFERSAMVGVKADVAFAFLSDPSRLPEYVATVTHVDTTAVDGEVELEVDAAGHETGVVRFLADPVARRIEWGRTGTDYAGSIAIDEGPISDTSQVTLRLHTSDESDAVEVERVVNQTVRNIGRLLVRR